MAKTRSQLFKDLSVIPTNSRWAWCAQKEEMRRAVFTLWQDEENPKNTWCIHDDNEVYRRNGYHDQKRVLDVAINNKYEIFGILCIAKNPNDSPRSIKEVKDDFIFKLKILRRGEKIFVKKIAEIPLLEILRKDKKTVSNDGLQDLLSIPIGNDIPDRALKLGYVIKRSLTVRRAVLKRAKGKCEYCGNIPFKMGNGDSFFGNTSYNTSGKKRSRSNDKCYSIMSKSP